MFLSIKFIERSYGDNLYRLSYILEDTDFTLNLNVPIERAIYDNRGDASIIPSGLIFAYSKLEKNIPKNLALFYSQSLRDVSRQEQLSFMNIDKVWTDTYFPEIKYGKKYYQCAINQLDILKFTGKFKNAKHIPEPILQED